MKQIFSNSSMIIELFIVTLSDCEPSILCPFSSLVTIRAGEMKGKEIAMGIFLAK